MHTTAIEAVFGSGVELLIHCSCYNAVGIILFYFFGKKSGFFLFFSLVRVPRRED